MTARDARARARPSAAQPGRGQARTRALGEHAQSLVEARRRCRTLARAHGENFTVLSLLAPRRLRTHLAVIYAYCRAVDDIGDEGRLPAELRTGEPLTVPAGPERVALLDRFERELDLAYAGRPESSLFVALAETVREFDLPREPFARLIEANRMDQRTARYATHADLLHYCEHSATPVGRLVLGLYRICDAAAQRLSDATCTALQLANFWQDVKRDFAMGRIYLPREDLVRFGVTEADLVAHRGSAAFCRLMQFEVARTRALFEQGLPLVDRVSGHLRIDLALFSRGGLAILDKIEKQGYDTLAERPSLSRVEKGRILLQAMAQKRWPALAERHGFSARER